MTSITKSQQNDSSNSTDIVYYARPASTAPCVCERARQHRVCAAHGFYMCIHVCVELVYYLSYEVKNTCTPYL